MKHTPKLMYATVWTKSGHEYEVVVDKYSGNRYRVVKGEEFLIGREYQYGHGLKNRRKIKG